MAYDVRTPPGRFALAQATHRGRIAWLGTIIFTIVGVAVLMVAVGNHRLGLLTSTLFLVATLAIRPHAERYLEAQLHWRDGGRAEALVGETLNELRHEGWYLLHDVEALGGGNVDHIASGPCGVFLIETKLRRYEDAQLGKAKRQAKLLHDELGGVWVTPVICLHLRKGKPPFETHGVWIVPHEYLLTFLRGQREKTVPFETLARFADRL